MATGLIPTATIRNVHSTLTFVNVEVWICPRGDRVELRTIRPRLKTEGAVKVGTYNNAIGLSEFIEDVKFAYREFNGMGVGNAA